MVRNHPGDDQSAKQSTVTPCLDDNRYDTLIGFNGIDIKKSSDKPVITLICRAWLGTMPRLARRLGAKITPFGRARDWIS